MLDTRWTNTCTGARSSPALSPALLRLCPAQQLTHRSSCNEAGLRVHSEPSPGTGGVHPVPQPSLLRRLGGCERRCVSLWRTARHKDGLHGDALSLTGGGGDFSSLTPPLSGWRRPVSLFNETVLPPPALQPISSQSGCHVTGGMDGPSHKVLLHPSRPDESNIITFMRK